MYYPIENGDCKNIVQGQPRLPFFYITSYQIIASSQEMGDCVSILPLFFILITFQLVFLKLCWCELFPFMLNSYIKPWLTLDDQVALLTGDEK
jgi:hypothetical protein